VTLPIPLPILMLVTTSIVLLATGVIVLVAVRLVRALRHTVELEHRVGCLQAGISLLTDTTEAGFRQVSAELERMSASTPPTAAVMRAATDRGRSVKDIAVAELVSELEVRRRMSLAESRASAPGRKNPEPRRDALRP